MNDEFQNLAKAARQLIETDALLGGEFQPAGANTLPEIQAPQANVGTTLEEMKPKDKAAALEQMKTDQVSKCVNCPLSQSRTTAVFGEGDADADLVFVGEAPGRDEDLSGRPFVGRAGELLTNMIHAMGLQREDVFICNILKCRPPNNRAPAPDEINACWDYLMRQLQIIRPKVIVTLGNPATQNLLQTRTGITRLRGQWQKLPDLAPGLANIDVMPTFHPSYVIRKYTKDTREKVWSDLQQVMTKLALKPPKG